MAALIAFYSRADENYFGGQYRYIPVGNTEKLAGMIAELTGADMFHIRQVQPYPTAYNDCIVAAKADQKAGARPSVLDLPANLDAYNTVYLGCPNYWGTMPMAVYTFLEAYDFAGKMIRPFVTHEGSGLSSIPRDIAKAAPGAVVAAGLAVCGSDVDSARGAVEKWLG